MDQDISSNRATDLDFSREETLAVAALLALAGGYIDAYSWITHRVFANAQTANMLFLWINAMEQEWARALHYLPSLAAFVIGVIMACWLRRLVGVRAAPISLLVEIISAWPAHSAFPSSPRCRRQAFLGLKRGVTAR